MKLFITIIISFFSYALYSSPNINNMSETVRHKNFSFLAHYPKMNGHSLSRIFSGKSPLKLWVNCNEKGQLSLSKSSFVGWKSFSHDEQQKIIRSIENTFNLTDYYSNETSSTTIDLVKKSLFGLSVMAKDYHRFDIFHNMLTQSLKEIENNFKFNYIDSSHNIVTEQSKNILKNLRLFRNYKGKNHERLILHDIYPLTFDGEGFRGDYEYFLECNNLGPIGSIFFYIELCSTTDNNEETANLEQQLSSCREGFLLYLEEVTDSEGNFYPDRDLFGKQVQNLLKHIIKPTPGLGYVEKHPNYTVPPTPNDLVFLFAIQSSYLSLKKVKGLVYGINTREQQTEKQLKKFSIGKNECESLIEFKGSEKIELSETYSAGFRGICLTFPEKHVSLICFRGSTEPNDFVADAHMGTRILPLPMGKEDSLSRRVAHYVLGGSALGAAACAASGIGSVAATGLVSAASTASLLSINEFIGKKELERYERHAIEFYDEMQLRNPRNKCFVAGHSLGGYLAQWVAYQNNCDGFGLSAPGLKENDERYSGEFINVRNKHDLVPQVSRHNRIGKDIMHDYAPRKFPESLNPVEVVSDWFVAPHSTSVFSEHLSQCDGDVRNCSCQN